MSYYTVKAKIDRALLPSSAGRSPSLTSKELKGILAEARKDGITEGEKRIVRDLYQKGYVKGSLPSSQGSFQLTASTQRGFAEFFWEVKWPNGPGVDLGRIATPGPRLAGKTFTVKPGEALRLELPSSKNFSVGAFYSTPEGYVRTSAAELAGQSGATRNWIWTLKVPPNATQGTVIPMRTNPGPYANQGPDWRFEFFIKVG
jgi:hypothetical protein